MARIPEWLAARVSAITAAAKNAAAKNTVFKAAVERLPPSTEQTVALLAVFVAGLAWWMSEVQACALLKSARLSQFPSISSMRDVSDSGGFRWTIENDGIGPLRIVEAKARVRLSTFELKTAEDVGNLWAALSPLDDRILSEVQGLGRRMLPPGGFVTLIDVPPSGPNEDLPGERAVRLRQAFRSFDVRIVFEDVYGDRCIFEQGVSSCPQLEEIKQDHCGRPG
jgi:hypothetical protein